jgi:hypothetical protein
MFFFLVIKLLMIIINSYIQWYCLGHGNVYKENIVMIERNVMDAKKNVLSER